MLRLLKENLYILLLTPQSDTHHTHRTNLTLALQIKKEILDTNANGKNINFGPFSDNVR